MSRGNKHHLPVPQICEDSTEANYNSIEKNQFVTDHFTKKKIRLDDKSQRTYSKLSNKMNESSTDKRPNFSALNSNIVKIPQVVNLKPGTTKKLVIKNFKSKLHSYYICNNFK